MLSIVAEAIIPLLLLSSTLVYLRSLIDPFFDDDLPSFKWCLPIAGLREGSLERFFSVTSTSLIRGFFWTIGIF